jgi:hypothetical protein
VRKERLELSRVSPLGPKPSASTSSATFARAVRFRTGRMPHTFGLRWGRQIIADAVRGSRRATERPRRRGRERSRAQLGAGHGCAGRDSQGHPPLPAAPTPGRCAIRPVRDWIPFYFIIKYLSPVAVRDRHRSGHESAATDVPRSEPKAIGRRTYPLVAFIPAPGRFLWLEHSETLSPMIPCKREGLERCVWD